MKQTIRLNENELKQLIKEAIEEIVSDYQPASYRGCHNVHLIWHGEYSDPELEYNGVLANYYDIEDSLYEWAKEEGLDADNDEVFNKFVQENEGEVCSMIEEYGNKEQELNESISRAIRKVLG